MGRPFGKPRGTPWRSGSESKTGDFLKAQGVTFGYETIKIKYVEPATAHNYTPDFILTNGVIIEVKGLFSLEDRKKHLLVRRQHPKLDIRLLFDRPQSPIRKGSPTTYAMWCDDHQILWAKGPNPPLEWLDASPSHPTTTH